MQKIVSMSNIAKEGQWDDFLSHSNVVLTMEQNKSSESFETEMILRERFIYVIIFYCFIDIISHILLYIVVNSEWMIKNDWKKEKLT